MSLHAMRLLPPNPFNFFAAHLLPVESKCIMAGAQAVIDTSAPGVETPLKANAASIVAGRDLKRLPQGVAAGKLRDYLQSAAQVSAPRHAGVLADAAYALGRLVDAKDDLHGISALMVAGAAILQGEVEPPSFHGAIAPPSLSKGLATWYIPVELWRRFEEIRSGQVHDPTSKGWVRNGLVNSGVSSWAGVTPDNLPLAGAGFAIGVSAVGSSDEGNVLVTAKRDGQSETEAYAVIDGQRALAVILGIEYLFGQFPWAEMSAEPRPLPDDLVTDSQAVSVLGRIHVPYDGMTVVFDGVTAEEDWLVPPMERFSRPLQADGKSLGDLQQGRSPELARLRRVFLEGVNWSNPVVDIASKIARAAGTNKRVLVLPAGSGKSQRNGASDLKVFRLSTDQCDFHLTIDDRDPKTRYAIVEGGKRFRGAHPSALLHEPFDKGTFVVGLRGDLGLLNIGPRADEGITPWTEYWPGFLANIPAALALLGLRSSRHPLSVLHRTVPAGARRQMLLEALLAE